MASNLVPFEDYELHEDHVWVKVNNVSVKIAYTDEGVAVDFYKDGNEYQDSRGGTLFLFAEAEDDE